MRGTRSVLAASSLLLILSACDRVKGTTGSLMGCADEISSGIRPIAETRDRRFQGKVQQSTAKCRGGDLAAGPSRRSLG